MDDVARQLEAKDPSFCWELQSLVQSFRSLSPHVAKHNPSELQPLLGYAPAQILRKAKELLQ